MSSLDDQTYQENTGALKIPKRKPGRPAGALAKDQEERLVDRVQEMYKTIEHMLTTEQRAYYKRAFSGKEAFDPMKHAEFFAVLYSIYAQDILLEAIPKKIVSQDIAQTLREYRMALKELDDMKARRDKEQEAKNEQSKLVDPTRKSSQSRLDEIIERASKEPAGRGRGRTRL